MFYIFMVVCIISFFLFVVMTSSSSSSLSSNSLSGSSKQDIEQGSGDDNGSLSTTSDDTNAKENRQAPTQRQGRRSRGEGREDQAKTKYALHWEKIGERLQSGIAPVLPSFERLGLTSIHVLKWMDKMAQCLATACIPVALRDVPSEKRDWRWLYLNPVTPLFHLNPIHDQIDYYYEKIEELQRLMPNFIKKKVSKFLNAQVICSLT